ncbi:MAG: PIN domain-containing protein [Methylocystis sp.]|uniref:PIN domain-containing protein n=1 Tax=Methylocystis sp. TaxID=1911079 RepID=UPI003DA69804
MILVDASIWVGHFRQTNVRLAALLNNSEALTHNFVIGELALGNMASRNTLLPLLRNLPRAPLASDDEVLKLIDRRALHGAGIGYVDAHLLAATLLAAPASLWTGDKRLQSAAARIGISVL